MKTVNSFGVCFAVRPQKNGDGRMGIYARITVNKSRCEIALKQFVQPGDWNERKGQVKPRNESLQQLNEYLESVRAKCYGHYRKLDQEGKVITAAVLKNAYLGLDDAAHQRTMSQVFKEHNRAMATVLALREIQSGRKIVTARTGFSLCVQPGYQQAA